IHAHKPGAIGLDILFTEQDRASLERIAENVRSRDRGLADQLAKLRPNDEILAETLQRTRVILGVAGVDTAIGRGTPRAHALIKGPKPPLHEYPAGLRSLPLLDHAAAGHALLNAEAERGIVRWMPVAAAVAGDPMLTMALETFRVGNRLASFNVNWSGKSINSVQVGDIEVPTNS